MKNTFTRFLITAIAALFFTGAYAQFPTIYATVASGNWGENPPATSPAATIWETFPGNATGTPGAQGTGSPYTGTDPGTATGPSGTHFVYIRAGHTVSMNGVNRSCQSMTIEPGGKLWANSATARRLQLVNGGTGFLYPQTGTITNNGTLGGIGDGTYFEAGTNCQNVTISGVGSTIVQRLRVPGGLAAAGGGVVNITIDQNITFTQANNYAVSLIYNPAPTDNYTLTLTSGKTLTISDPAGYFNSNSLGTGAMAFGTYTYIINGTLDLSASTQTTANLTAFSPPGPGGTVNLNLTGGLKTGAGFNSSPVSPAVANITVASGVVVDATRATVMNFNGGVFALQNAAALRRTVPNDGSKTEFPIGVYSSTAVPTHNAVIISGTTGPVEIFTATVKSTFTNPTPTNTLPREWGINETTGGGNEDTLRFTWTTADVGSSGFSSAGTVFIIRWNGTTWDYKTAPVTGTGTVADPFSAKGIGFTNFGFFALTNSSPTPVAFANLRVAQNSGNIQVDFSNATELDVVNYVIERSSNGNSFAPVTTLPAKTNNGSLNSYTFMDANSVRGTNFYRIKATERSGHVIYSAVVKVITDGTRSGVTVYPNPVKGSNVSVQLENLDKAVYTVSLFNKLGQNIYSKQINHLGGSATLVIELPASANSGLYNLHVSSAAFKTVKNIIIE